MLRRFLTAIPSGTTCRTPTSLGSRSHKTLIPTTLHPTARESPHGFVLPYGTGSPAKGRSVSQSESRRQQAASLPAQGDGRLLEIRLVLPIADLPLRLFRHHVGSETGCDWNRVTARVTRRLPLAGSETRGLPRTPMCDFLGGRRDHGPTHRTQGRADPQRLGDWAGGVNVRSQGYVRLELPALAVRRADHPVGLFVIHDPTGDRIELQRPIGE